MKDLLWVVEAKDCGVWGFVDAFSSRKQARQVCKEERIWGKARIVQYFRGYIVR